MNEPGTSQDKPDGLNYFTRQQLLFEIARVFKKADKADRYWLADQIIEGRRRVHEKGKSKDIVDQALLIVGEL